MNIMKFIKLHSDGRPEVLKLKVAQNVNQIYHGDSTPRRYNERKPTRREAIILASHAGFTPIARVHNTVKTFVRRIIHGH